MMYTAAAVERDRNLAWTAAHLSAAERALLAEHTTNPGVWNSEENRLALAALLARVPPTQQPLTLWSGLEVPLGDLRLGAPAPTPLPYLTSSYKRDVARKYAETFGAMLVLSVPAGSRVLFLDAVSAHGDAEGEVLLDAAAELRATRVDRDEEAIVLLEVDYADSWNN